MIKTPKQFVKAFKRHGSLKAVARKEGMTYYAVRMLYAQAVKDQLMDPQRVGAKSKEDMTKTVKKAKPEGRLKAMPTPVLTLPAEGEINRYLFTSAQNNTKVPKSLWTNIQALAEHYDAQIHVSRFTYVKTGLGASGDKARILKKEELYGGVDLWWDKELEPYFSDERLEVAPGLVWCGEMNILPTAVNPLSGLQVYTGRKSGIFPHVKIAMESIPSMRDDPTKFNYTTGAITMRNYIQRKAGLKAEFHHCYGALLVEVDSDGDWFCRQINADSTGTIYDLDVRVKNGEVTVGNRPKSITWGDTHVDDLDPVVKELAWGEGGMLDTLHAEEQHSHDVLNFSGRGHHNIKNPHEMFKHYVQGTEDVRAEVTAVGEFLIEIQRDWCKGVIVDSNHHNHMGRWLQEQNGLKDPVNAEFWIAMQARMYEMIRKGQPLNYLKEALGLVGFHDIDLATKFLNEDDSYIICPDASGGIECGIHGHNGANGSRGNPNQYAKMGRKANTGHSHKAGIIDGVYTSGTCSILNPDYVRGPGAWSHSHILTYKNGKRAIITMYNGKWRA